MPRHVNKDLAASVLEQQQRDGEEGQGELSGHLDALVDNCEWLDPQLPDLALRAEEVQQQHMKARTLDEEIQRLQAENNSVRTRAISQTSTEDSRRSTENGCATT
eukprot:scaffold37418_cov28-Prasinocladus_malaysianus.AAC.1